MKKIKVSLGSNQLKKELNPLAPHRVLRKELNPVAPYCISLNGSDNDSKPLAFEINAM